MNVTRAAGSAFLNPWRIAGWGFALFLLLLPAIAMRYTREVNWTASDFVFAAVIFGSVGLGFELAVRASRSGPFRAGAAAALVTGLLVVWSNLAVGIIGNEAEAPNLLFFALVAITILAAVINRRSPHALAGVMAATALVQFAIPLAAMMIWSLPLDDGMRKTLLFNSIFALFWLGSAALFRRAAR